MKDVPVGQAVLGDVGELVFLIGEHILSAGKVARSSVVSEGVGRHAGRGHGSEQSLRCVVAEGGLLRAPRNPGALPSGVHAQQREDVAVQRIGHARQVAVRVVDVGGSVAGRVGHGGQPSHGVVGEAFSVGSAVHLLHQARVTVEGVVAVGLLVLALDGDGLDAVQVVVRVFGYLTVSVQGVQASVGQVGHPGGDLTLLGVVGELFPEGLAQTVVGGGGDARVGIRQLGAVALQVVFHGDGRSALRGCGLGKAGGVIVEGHGFAVGGGGGNFAVVVDRHHGAAFGGGLCRGGAVVGIRGGAKRGFDRLEAAFRVIGIGDVPCLRLGGEGGSGYAVQPSAGQILGEGAALVSAQQVGFGDHLPSQLVVPTVKRSGACSGLIAVVFGREVVLRCPLQDVGRGGPVRMVRFPETAQAVVMVCGRPYPAGGACKAPGRFIPSVGGGFSKRIRLAGEESVGAGVGAGFHDGFKVGCCLNPRGQPVRVEQLVFYGQLIGFARIDGFLGDPSNIVIFYARLPDVGVAPQLGGRHAAVELAGVKSPAGGIPCIIGGDPVSGGGDLLYRIAVSVVLDVNGLRELGQFIGLDALHHS